MAAPSSDSDHLVSVPGTDEWRLWRCVAVRGAGFPHSLASRLASPAASRAARDLLAAEVDAVAAREKAIAAVRRVAAEDASASALCRSSIKLLAKGRVPEATKTAADTEIEAFRLATERVSSAVRAFHETFDREREVVFRHAQGFAADPRFREAVTWQNRRAVARGFASLLKADARARRSKDRENEALIASYAQRYCTKNDTIGFFGPLGWARVTDGGPAISVRPGSTLVAARNVHFEQWGIDEIAAKLSSDPRFRSWMVPRRYPFVRLDGASVFGMRGKQELTPAQLRVFEACDGVRTAAEIVALLSDAVTESDVFEALGFLRDRQIIAWAFELPLLWAPERNLQALLARVGDDALRQEAEALLGRLVSARAEVQRAAGDAEQLDRALAALDSTFTEITGAPASRQAGSMYAARQLVFEDCRRSMEMEIGPDVVRELTGALDLVLTSARWFTFEVARVYRETLRTIHSELAQRSPSGKVRFSDLWFRAQRFLVGTSGRPVDAVKAALQERWARILKTETDARTAHFESSRLRPLVLEAFDAPHSGWRAARYHSPDVMIAAPSAEAIRSGNYLLVLGELHCALNTLDYGSFRALHPSPDELQQAFERDMPDPLVVPVYAKDSPLMTVRTSRPFFAPWSYYLETGLDIAPGPRDRVLAFDDLELVERDGLLSARAPDGTVFEILELFGRTLSPVATLAFGIFPAVEHRPRITIDRLVVARETWSFPPSALEFAEEADEARRFLAAHRWAEAHRLPRRFFVKAAFEDKPVFVDLDSPVFVNGLARLARKRHGRPNAEAPLVITEMLPDLGETWLTDAAGERYTSELRMVAVYRR